MAIKKTKKVQGIVKNDNKGENNSEDSITNISDTNKVEENKMRAIEKEKPKENENIKPYKIYDIDIEFKLKEIISEGEKVLIGPNRLTRFEKARITGARSLQLSLGAPVLSKIPSDLTDTIMIAKYELEKKTLPISIRRILPNGLYQDIPIEWTL